MGAASVDQCPAVEESQTLFCFPLILKIDNTTGNKRSLGDASLHTRVDSANGKLSKQFLSLPRQHQAFLITFLHLIHDNILRVVGLYRMRNLEMVSSETGVARKLTPPPEQ
jgi:hypothetical protein